LGAWLFVALLTPSAGSAGQLADGMAVRVRLLQPISSETSKSGQPLQFVVTRDVIVDGEIVIARGALVAGAIVEARRADWGFFEDDRPRLVFRFFHTTASNGQVIRLRASPARRPHDRVVVDRLKREHELQWATEADTFDAYVDGNYQW
jgi:hypothetical protein